MELLNGVDTDNVYRDNFAIGNFNNSSHTSFNGKIADVRVYKEVLNE